MFEKTNNQVEKFNNKEKNKKKKIKLKIKHS